MGKHLYQDTEKTWELYCGKCMFSLSRNSQGGRGQQFPSFVWVHLLLNFAFQQWLLSPRNISVSLSHTWLSLGVIVRGRHFQWISLLKPMLFHALFLAPWSSCSLCSILWKLTKQIAQGKSINFSRHLNLIEVYLPVAIPSSSNAFIKVFVRRQQSKHIIAAVTPCILSANTLCLP